VGLLWKMGVGIISLIKKENQELIETAM